jgi:hypothetical protein
MADEFEEDSDLAEVMTGKIEELEVAARSIGLYLDHAAVVQLPPDGKQLAIIGDFMIGDVAFTARVQDPEQEQVDRMFFDLTSGLGNDDFLDSREQIKRNIAEGRHPLDDGK